KALLACPQGNDLCRVPEPPKKPRVIGLRSDDGQAPIPLEALSDGYQSIIGVAADIIEIMLRHWSDIKDSEGIVLLDDLDVHVHPSWKAEIVGLLRATFPRVQFVITTHDPLCLLGTRQGEVHVLRRQPGTESVTIDQVDVPPGLTADQVLTGSWFGLTSTL